MSINQKVAIVAPVHIQPSAAWVESVRVAARDARVIIVDDSNGKVTLPSEWDVYPYARQEEMLGSELFARFRQFHKSPPCKNVGVWIAWKNLVDVIVVIDSDCILPPDFIAEHLRALAGEGEGWENPLAGTGWYSRGFPYHKRKLPVDVHMGLWTNELDINGKDRVVRGIPPKEPVVSGIKVAQGMVPLSGMNVSFRREAAPAMMFMPHFDYESSQFRRHDDIWGGYLLQKLMQRLERTLSYGAPFVFHDTEVFPERDARDEDAMIAHEKKFYAAVDNVCAQISGGSYHELFAEFARVSAHHFAEKYPMFLPLARACAFWRDLFATA